MLVAEDIAANEIRRFFVVDASLHLGSVKVGTTLRTFDPARAFTYFGSLENQLIEYASHFSESFQYIPRRAYSYLKHPPILSSLCQSSLEEPESSWLVDQFLTCPLISVGHASLPKAEQMKNTKSIQEWSMGPPYGPRLYYIQDMRHGRRTRSGWGCIMKAADLGHRMGETNLSDLDGYVQMGHPVIVEMDEPDDIDIVLKWLIALKEAGRKGPSLLLNPRAHKDWNAGITKLVDIPRSRILTSGATISSLSTLVRHLRKTNKEADWSSRLVFATRYPETQSGDGVSEILSYLLSKNLAATPQELQRVLGGNILSMMPPRPPFLSYADSDSAVVAEGHLGKASLNEIARILRLAVARGLQSVASVDYMTGNDGGVVHLDGALVTLTTPSTNTATSMAIILERNGSLKLAGWKRTFTDTLQTRDSEAFSTLARSIAMSYGLILSSPSHMTRFDQAVMSCLQVKNPQEILSALHFQVDIADYEQGAILVSPDDMRALNVSEGDHLFLLDTATTRWWVGRAVTDREHPRKRIGVSSQDAMLGGFTKSRTVDLAKTERKAVNLNETVLAFDNEDSPPNGETSASLHLRIDTVRRMLHDRFVGKGMKFNIENGGQEILLTFAWSNPGLDSSQIGRMNGASIQFQPSQSLREFNVIICISADQNMRIRDITLKSKYSIRSRLEPLVEKAPELGAFLSSLGNTITRAELAALFSLLVLGTIANNRTGGRMGIVTVTVPPQKFSVQKRGVVQSFVEFREDLSSEEVLVSMIYSILDTLRQSVQAVSIADGYRAVAEMLEDFGPERPTLVMILGSDVDDDRGRPFLRAIAESERCLFDFMGLGMTFDEKKAPHVFDGIVGRVYPITSFSTRAFDDYLLGAIDHIVPIVEESESKENQ